MYLTRSIAPLFLLVVVPIHALVLSHSLSHSSSPVSYGNGEVILLVIIIVVIMKHLAPSEDARRVLLLQVPPAQFPEPTFGDCLSAIAEILLSSLLMKPFC